MKLATSSHLRAIDASAINDYHIASLDLMERAGRSVAEEIEKHFSSKKKVSVFAGKGNNGGDGFVTARLLSEKGFEVKLFVLYSWKDFSKDARTNWERLVGLKIEVFELGDGDDVKGFVSKASDSDILVDAIFGTGLANEVKGRPRQVIEAINSLLKPVVSVDMPSGLCAESGQPLGAAVRARLTVTFGLMKLGLAVGQGPEYSKETVVADIGFPPGLIDKTETGFFLITREMVRDHFKKRDPSGHKGDYGHVLVIAGSLGKMGAGFLSSRAALVSGAGLVTYALPKGAFARFDSKGPEIMIEPLEDEDKGIFTGKSLPSARKALAKKTVLAIGPGLGTDKETIDFVTDVVSKSVIPTVIDADGLNAIVSHLGVIDGKKSPKILTPHPGEMSRLTGLTTQQVLNDRIAIAKKFAGAHGVHLVLKGHRTIVADPDGNVYINPTGNPGMATAGMGDVLTGVIAGFLAQGLPVTVAVLAAVYLHGMAGDLAVKESGERGLIASDLLRSFQKAVKDIEEYFQKNDVG